MSATKLSEGHLSQMEGGIKITPRNLIFLITDRKKNSFDDTNLDETVKWLKSSLTFYYFNSFVDSSGDNKTENNDLFSKQEFVNAIYNSFKKQKKLIITSTNDVSEE